MILVFSVTVNKNNNFTCDSRLLQRRNCPYDLRDRIHDRELIQKETGLGKEFITRMLFKDSY